MTSIGTVAPGGSGGHAGIAMPSDGTMPSAIAALSASKRRIPGMDDSMGLFSLHDYARLCMTVRACVRVCCCVVFDECVLCACMYAFL